MAAGELCGEIRIPVPGGTDLTSKAIPSAMDLYQFLRGVVLGLSIGVARLNQLHFIAHNPILTGILQVTKLPV
jgi:hypothetical protein